VGSSKHFPFTFTKIFIEVMNDSSSKVFYSPTYQSFNQSESIISAHQIKHAKDTKRTLFYVKERDANYLKTIKT
jgi:hypothetical protein